jgi:hypothetical protein
MRYSDPSGRICIAGFNVDWIPGESCSDEDSGSVAQFIDYAATVLTSPHFKMGYYYELVDSLMVVGPETTRQIINILINSDPSLKRNFELQFGTASLLCGNSGPMLFLNLIRNGIQGDSFFNMGRAAGRMTALAASLSLVAGSIEGGALSIAAAPGTFGISLSVTTLSVEMAGYGTLVAGSVAVKELNDHLIVRAFSVGKAFQDPTLGYPSNTGDTGDNAKILRDNMGVGKTPGEAAHHIVPSTDSYAAARQAREKLHELDIDINAKENGVLLTTDIHNGLSRNHVYMDAVLSELQNVTTKDRAIQVLQDIASRLLNGGFPR